MVLAFEFIFLFGCAESSLLCELFSSCVSVATLSLWFIIMWFIYYYVVYYYYYYVASHYGSFPC